MMQADAIIDETTLVERVVLLGVTWLEVREETPARLDEARSVCNDQLREVTGRLSEADVATALNTLSAAEFVEEVTRESESPVGKGRPAYSLTIDIEETLEALATDEQLAEPVDELRRQRS